MTLTQTFAALELSGQVQLSLSCFEMKGSQHMQPNVGQAIVSAVVAFEKRRDSKMILKDSGTVKMLTS